MIDLYTWSTPNGRKVFILLEELGLEYMVHPIDTQKGGQKAAEFLEINPNGRIPAVVERNTGLKLFESGAILIYLADKYMRFLPSESCPKAEVMPWLMWQMGGLGPMAGQAHHYFRRNRGKAPYTEDRLRTEVARLYSVLDSRLQGREYICEEYSIADIACWPWISRYEWHEVDLSGFPNVRDWYRRVMIRDAVQAGYHIPVHMGEIPPG